MLNPVKPMSRSRSTSERSGYVLVTVMVVFTISLALFGLWARAAISQHQQLRNENLRLQAVRLAEAGVQRAIARRAVDPQYADETWAVPAEQLGGSHAAEVRIRVEPTADASALSAKATAQYPAGSLRRAQITKQVEIINAESGTDP